LDDGTTCADAGGVSHARLLVVLLPAAVATSVTRARAAPPPPAFDARANPTANAPSDAPPSDWRALGYLGGYGRLSGEPGGAAVVGASFQYRAGPYVGGALVEAGGVPFGYGQLGGALLGGFGVRPVPLLRLEVLGLVGVRRYGGVGSSFYGSDPGASAVSGYAGARGGMSFVFGKKRGHFELGLYADVEDDLSRQHVEYTYTVLAEGVPDGTATANHDIGMVRLGFGLELGGVHDIFE
jgi:hypothetical protein